MGVWHELFDGNGAELPSDTPRVDALIAKVTEAHTGISRTAQAEYYEEVHQHLAPLARELERENANRELLAAEQLGELAAALEDRADVVSKALRKAWQLGQTYWQQADSEYTIQHRKADETQARFQALVDETRAAILADVTPNAKVSGAGTASAGLPGYAGDNNGEKK